MSGYSDRRRDLTPRMHDVLAGACDGETALQTARRLHISVSTVKDVRSAAYARMHVPNLHAATAAYRDLRGADTGA